MKTRIILITIFLFAVSCTTNAHNIEFCSTALSRIEPISMQNELIIFKGRELGNIFSPGKDAIYIYDFKKGDITQWLFLNEKQNFSWEEGQPGKILLGEDNCNKIHIFNINGQRLNSNEIGISTDRYHFSPEGERVSFLSMSRVGIERLEDSDLVTVDIENSYNSDLSWSPEGDAVAFISRKMEDGDNPRFQLNDSDFSLYIVKKDGTELRALIEGLRGINYLPQWSPNGKWIAIGQYMLDSQDLHLKVVEVSNHPSRLISSPNFKGGLADYSWSPDNVSIAGASFYSNEYTLWVWNIETNQVENIFHTNENDKYLSQIRSVIWVSDHELVIAATSSDDPTVRCYSDGSGGKLCTMNLFLVDIKTKVITQLTHKSFTTIQDLTYWK